MFNSNSSNYRMKDIYNLKLNKPIFESINNKISKLLKDIFFVNY